MTPATGGPAPDLEAALRRLGHDRFLPGQGEAIATLLAEGRLLLVAPTGGGKSLTYQLPATVLPGTTFVVSPLVALMHDQVAALEARGVAATYLAATLPVVEIRARMGRIARGEVKLAYVAPERLVAPGFRSLATGVDCPLVAVDEAHCISEWGHDFRPEYMEIGPFLGEMKGARVLACTATATPVVRDEILERLGLGADTPQRVHGFARPNLGLRVREILSRRDRDGVVDATLTEALGSPGEGRGTAIVYAPTRRATEEEAARLAEHGWRVGAYHAGLAGSVRDRVQTAFASGRTEIVVATNAFGMGIDRPDVRAVIHLGPPGSIEAYYQEVGRAGRDGRDAIGLLCLSARDLPLRRHLLESPVAGQKPDPRIVEHKWGMFLELVRWAEGGSCRHDAILRYFGDEKEVLAGCGKCDVCQTLGGEHAQDPEEVTLVVRKALSGVARVHGRFGLQTAVRLLRGNRDPRLERSGLEDVRTFGVLAERPETWILRVLRRCVTAGWVDFRGGERPVVVLTPSGREVMRGEAPARILLPEEPGVPRRSSGPERRSAAPTTADLDETAQAIFEALRRYRLDRARTEGVPPYVVASDRTLRDVAMLRPRNADELKLAHGIGPAKLERYGEAFLAVVREASPKAPRSP